MTYLRLGFSALVIISGLVVTPVVTAHTLETESSIGALLHLSPNDEPTAGQPTQGWFDFKDTKDKWQADACECTVTIQRHGQVLATEPLSFNGSTGSFRFIFPEPDVYQLVVNGKPKNPHAFSAFTLTYDVRVTQQATTTATTWITELGEHSLHFIILGIGAIIVIPVILRERRR